MIIGALSAEEEKKVATNSVLVLDLNEAVFRQAAQIRAQGNLKMPDALHVACAQFHGCTALWTNDERLAEVSGGLAESIVGDQA
jgi:predicted nucleic acid-binding protein